MKKTRELDLEKLQDAKFTRSDKETKDHIEAIQAAVFEQSKDPFLETMRKNLTATLQEIEEQGESDELWNKYVTQIATIEKYTSSPAFIMKITESIARQVNQTEAERYFKEHMVLKGGEKQ